MKNRFALLLILLLLLLPLGPALGEADYRDGLYHCFHASPDCALARQGLAQDGGGTCYPCPACVPDEAAYPGVEAWERGGTAVVRIPDSLIAEALAEGAEPAEVPEALLCVANTRDEDLARLVHGLGYLNLLRGARAGETLRATAFIPEYSPKAGDVTVLNQRHIGAAWYLTVRPAGAELSLWMNYYRAELDITALPGGLTFAQGEGTAVKRALLTVKPEKSGGEVVYRSAESDFFGDDGRSIYVIRDGNVNICVIREKNYDPEYGLFRRADYCGSVIDMTGYEDKKDAVFCCVLTDGELAAMQEKLYFPMDGVPFALRQGEPAAPETAAADYAPVDRATLPDGTLARMSALEYPVGTPFVAVVFSRPEGGVGWYSGELPLEKLSGGFWKRLGNGNLRGRNGDGEPGRGGWFCGEIGVAYPLEDFGALDAGLYRLELEEDGEGATAWLEFRIAEGAPEAALPRPDDRAADLSGLDLSAHATAHDDPAAYNSCADTSRHQLSSEDTRLLAGSTVYALLGVEDSWGWGVGTRYDLFAWPEGRPGEVRQLIAGLEHSDMTLYDLGDGLLLTDAGGRFYRCDLDGKNLTGPFAPFDGEEQGVYDLLPVGRGVYLCREDGVWYAEPWNAAPEKVYTPEHGMDNGDEGTGYMVYADGKLLVADGGIVALDTARRDGDGMMPATRLTRAYDREDGACGFGYIVLGGRLYCWDAKKKATVSMKLDGSDVKKVSKTHFWFYQVEPDGAVLALTGTRKGLFGDERTAAAIYYPRDPGRPAFDPDHCEKREIRPEESVFFLGEELCEWK